MLSSRSINFSLVHSPSPKPYDFHIILCCLFSSSCICGYHFSHNTCMICCFSILSFYFWISSYRTYPFITRQNPLSISDVICVTCPTLSTFTSQTWVFAQVKPSDTYPGLDILWLHRQFDNTPPSSFITDERHGLLYLHSSSFMFLYLP